MTGSPRRLLPRRARAAGDDGASLVEFALVLPIFFMLLLGMFTGGLAYNRRLTVTQSAREGARYGATLPVTAALPLDSWLSRVATVTAASASGELDAAQPGQYLCVALVPGAGTPRRRVQQGASVSFNDATCFDDGRAGETRVQVVAARSSRLEALVFSRDLDLRARSVARFEAS